MLSMNFKDQIKLPGAAENGSSAAKQDTFWITS